MHFVLSMIIRDDKAGELICKNITPKIIRVKTPTEGSIFSVSSSLASNKEEEEENTVQNNEVHFTSDMSNSAETADASA